MAAMVAAGPFWPVHFAAAQDFVFGAVVAATKEGVRKPVGSGSSFRSCARESVPAENASGMAKGQIFGWLFNATLTASSTNLPWNS